MLCAAMRSLPCCGGVRPPVNVVSESYAQVGSITRLKEGIAYATGCQPVQSTSTTFPQDGVRLAGQEAPGRTRRQRLRLLDAVRGHDFLPVGPRGFATRDLQRVGLQ